MPDGTFTLPEHEIRRARIIGSLQAALLRLTWMTWRVNCDASPIDTPLSEGRRVILAFWHGKYVPIFAALSGRHACIFTSLSRRGAIIAEICRRFGYQAVMIPDHGADASYETMMSALTEHSACGIAADGPLGPYHVVKRGVVRLASDLGFEIIACSVASKPKRVFADRWDRMEVPRPFARVCLAMSDPIVLPPDLGDGEVATWSTRVKQELKRMDEAAEEMLGRK